MKKCTRCKTEKEHDKFYKQVQQGKNGQRWTYLDSMCKSCRSTYTHNRRRERKAKAIAYLGGHCKDCGLIDENQDVYDFHHNDPSEKDFSISKINWSFEKIKVELDKCSLLCANCHRKRHAWVL